MTPRRAVLLAALLAVVVAAVVVAVGAHGTPRTAVGATSGHLSPSPTHPSTTRAAPTTTSLSHPPPTAAAKLGPGAEQAFRRAVARLQAGLRAGTLVGVGAAPDAVLRCPDPVPLAPGHAFACRVTSTVLGSALLVAEVGPGGSLSPVVGDTVGCAGLSLAGRQALEAIGEACNP